ncbi:MAG: hypothetical protein E7666_01775 [Ruminococcaceae bacterium]|nr:hypothetical protein [Oscillospiraceae bacterium]
MKKRLMCLFLCLIMVLGALASCSSATNEQTKNKISDTASEQAITLTMWIVSEEKVSPQTASAVSEALNVLTKAKFKTQLILHYFTEDEYRAKLEETISAYEEDIANGVITLEPETESESGTGADTIITDETETNEWGMSVIKYPEAVKNQVDIIYIAGEDMYLDFIDKGWLNELDTELGSASKKIKEYVSQTLLSAVKQNGVTYAVPNNRVIGEYTYMLLNKELMDKYAQQGYVTTGKIDGFYNTYLYTFLNLIDKFEDDSVVAIDNTYLPNPDEKVDAYDYCLDLLAHYWSIDPYNYSMLDEFSIFGYHYQSIEDLTRGSVELGFNSLFEDEEFTAEYLQLNKFRYDGYFGDATGKTAALKFVDGDYTFLDAFYSNGYCVYEGEEYYPVPVVYPTASTEDIFGNMFGVCTYTRDVGRSMEIITYMNTNAEFRNILQYGVEGTHYEMIDNGNGTTTLKYLVNDYKMDIYSTGNVFMAHPQPHMSADIWENGKVQNRYSMVDPLLGFDFAGHAAGAVEEESGVTINTKVGYTVLYSTGYSKTVLSQNADLAKWIQDSDEAGKGLYVYKTYMIDGSDLTINYYVYNNNLTKKTNFSVKDVRDVEITVNDKGKEIVTQTNLDFILTYEDTEEDSETGYELSMVSLYTRKNNSFEILGNINGTDIKAEDIPTTEKDKLLVFDIMNTEEYSIEIYDNVRKPTFYRNAELMNWINACDKNKDKNPASYVLSYVSEPKDGKVERIFAFYRTGLKYVTDLEILPTGEMGELNLLLNYSHSEDNQLDTHDGDVNYQIYYLRIITDEDVDFSYTITSNGEEVRLFGANKDERTEAAGDAKPDFVMLGNLDTELVKIMYTLNQELVAKLEACKNIDELTALVGEMKKLLTTGENAPLLSSFTILKDLAEKYAVDSSLKNFYRDILCITGYTVVELTEQDPENPQKEIPATYEDVNGNKESYIYYDSPYAIYRSWMQTYGFLPK